MGCSEHHLKSPAAAKRSSVENVAVIAVENLLTFCFLSGPGVLGTHV
jgi:hypothetical protein